MAVRRRNLNGITQSQIIELIKFSRRIAHAVAFIDAEENGLAGFEQHLSYFLVGRRHAVTNIRHQNGDIRSINGDLCLPAHLHQNDIIGRRLNTAGIDQHKLLAAPFAFGINAVTRNARGVLHNGQTLADEFIE